MIAEMDFRPNPDLVSVVRRFVAEFFDDEIGHDASQNAALAAHELLENAVKYSLDGHARVELSSDGQGVSVRLSNRASAEHRECLTRAVAKLSQAADPFAHYQDLMRETMFQEGSGLGLARIAAETDMTLSVSLDGEDYVSIIAHAPKERF